MTTDKPQAGTAAAFSFVFSGLGQLYNGQILKGLLIISLSCASTCVVILGALCIGFWMVAKVIFASQLIIGVLIFVVGLAGVCALGIYSIVDAYTFYKKK